MKVTLKVILIILMAFLPGCSKDDKPKYSGTVTINNRNAGTDPTYYVNGFHVPTGKLIADLNNQPDIITINPEFDVNYNPLSLYFTTNNFTNSFYLYGTYPDEQSSVSAFRSLISLSSPQWAELGSNVSRNQIWIYRTDDEKVAKIRITSTLSEKREGMPFPYSECTFEWVFQPDGTMTFPGK